MDYKKIVDFWLKGSAQNWKTAQGLFKIKRYSDCLFYCHLTLEKLLKGIVVKETRKHAPYIHELDKLARQTGLDFSKEQMKYLKIITTFSINARYDDAKFSFYRRCTKKYSKEYLEITKKLYLWLRREYRKK